MRAKAHVWVAVGALGLLYGCATRDVQSYQVIKVSPSIASQYRCPPAPSLALGYFGFYFDGDVWVASADGLSKYAITDDVSFGGNQHHFLGQSMSTIVPDRKSGFVVTELAGSVTVKAYRFEGSVANSVAVGGSDFFQIQLSQDGERWYAESYGGLLRKNRDDTYGPQRGPLFFETIEFIPGAYGRLMKITESDSTRWLDAEASLFLGDPVFHQIPNDAKVWVDQGHVLYQSKGTVYDAGRLSTLTNISSKREAFGFSPWNLSRTDDKLTLLATSIFADGPVVTIKRTSQWRQETIAYGLHAIVSTNELQNPIEFYDLRKGKLVATLERSSENPLDFLLQFTDGVFCGTDRMIQAAKLDPKEADRYQVLRRLQDLLQLKR